VIFDGIYYVQAIDPDGVAQSTAAITAAVWENFATDIRMAAPQYALEELSFVPPAGSQYAPEKTCDTRAAAIEWCSTLDPEED
jgi:hypothetical protein